MNTFLDQFLKLLPDWLIWTIFFIALEYLFEPLVAASGVSLEVIVNLLLSVAALFLTIGLRIIWDSFLDRRAERRDAALRSREEKVEQEVKELKEKLEKLEKENRGENL